MRIAYIAGWGRSGSTLLARLLAIHPEAVFVGELRDLWTRGVVEDRLCGCGQRFSRCPWWTEVGERAFGGWDRVDANRAVDLRARVDRPWQLRQLAKGPAATDPNVRAYGALIDQVLRAIDAASGNRVVIDSSKIPSFGVTMSARPDIDLRVVHLTRDSRGTVHSWGKQVRRHDDPARDAYMLQYGAVAAAARYRLYHGQSDRLRRSASPYRRVRYEDLVEAPREEVGALLAFLGLDASSEALAAIGPGRAEVGISHSVVGNPMRLQTGALTLRPDVAWQSEMPRHRRLAVTAITRPLLRRYRYPIAGGTPADVGSTV